MENLKEYIDFRYNQSLKNVEILGRERLLTLTHNELKKHI